MVKRVSVGTVLKIMDVKVMSRSGLPEGPKRPLIAIFAFGFSLTSYVGLRFDVFQEKAGTSNDN